MPDIYSVELVLFGRMQILARLPDGTSEPLEIKSAKARGLLALLALAPSHCRSRNWLRDMLWSDRDRAQASASLRQELRNLTQTHPALDAVVQRSRKLIQLDEAQVSVRSEPPSPDQAGFLEDLDIQDPAFAKWLAAERAERDPTTPAAPFVSAPGVDEKRRIVAFRTSTPSQDPNSFLETTLAHFIGQSLNEHIQIDVIDADAARATPETTWVEIHAVPRDDTMSVVRISVRDGPRRLLIWSDLQNLPCDMLLDIHNTTLLSYCHQIVCGVLDALVLRQPRNPDDVETGMIAHLATRKVFSMEADQMQVADELLNLANRRQNRGVFLAWRALVRAFQIVERHSVDAERLAYEAHQLCAEAIELEPRNSMVLSLVANAHLALGDDVATCKAYAEDSVRMNPSNPFSWDSLSGVRLYQNDLEGAHRLAIRAQEVSKGTAFGFWWDMGRSITAASVGQLDEAIKFAEATQMQSPLFRPPKRYLIGLYSAKGWEEKAQQALDDLRLFEPDFAPTQLTDDPRYPSSLLLAGGLYDRNILRELR